MLSLPTSIVSIVLNTLVLGNPTKSPSEFRRGRLTAFAAFLAAFASAAAVASVAVASTA